MAGLSMAQVRFPRSSKNLTSALPFLPGATARIANFELEQN
jgi:hypothetical protein